MNPIERAWMEHPEARQEFVQKVLLGHYGCLIRGIYNYECMKGVCYGEKQKESKEGKEKEK